MIEEILSVKNLVAYYRTSPPVRAVDDVSFSVGKGEIFGIVGESGCGKSTLSRAILKLLGPPGYIERGEVLFKGVNLLKVKKKELNQIRWKHISYIPQGSMNSLNPVMRVEDQIEDAIRAHEYGRKRKAKKEEIKKRIEELLINVGLAPEVARMYPHELSGGMKQRVVIAMAIALNPELIVADEPTTALDVVVQRGILQLLSDIKSRTGSSIILITHDMAAQCEVADRIAVMYAGKIVEISPVDRMFKEPLHPYSQGLISAVPSVIEKKELKGLSGEPPDLRYPPSGCRFHPRCPRQIFGKCSKEEPPYITIDGRLVACHIYARG
jgi:peptide/nickel transport system ATP-binding protein